MIRFANTEDEDLKTVLRVLGQRIEEIEALGS
jgi:hypothetical protein